MLLVVAVVKRSRHFVTVEYRFFEPSAVQGKPNMYGLETPVVQAEI